MASEPIVALALLPEIQSMVTRLGAQSGFRLISGFADRHGAWEMRLAAKHPSSTGFISFACDETPKGDALRCELSAGYTQGTASEKRVIGTFKLKSLDTAGSALIERKFGDAVKASGAMKQDLSREARAMQAEPAAASRYAIGK